MPTSFARVSGSIGYWNVLAAIIVMAIPIALEAATRQSLPIWLRGLVSSGLVILGFTLLLYLLARRLRGPRGGAGRVLRALHEASGGARLAGCAGGARGGGPLPRTPPRNALHATSNDALRTAQGHALARWVVVALVVAFAVQALVAVAHRRWPLPARTVRVVGIAVLVILVAAPLAFGAFYFPRHGGLDRWVRVHYDAALAG